MATGGFGALTWIKVKVRRGKPTRCRTARSKSWRREAGPHIGHAPNRKRVATQTLLTVPGSIKFATLFAAEHLWMIERNCSLLGKVIEAKRQTAGVKPWTGIESKEIGSR